MALKLITGYNYCNLEHAHNTEAEAERCNETQLKKINAKNELDGEKKELKKQNDKNEARIKELEKELEKEQKQNKTAEMEIQTLRKKIEQYEENIRRLDGNENRKHSKICAVM